MPDIIAKHCTKGDENGILNVCYRTGYMGEDLTNMGIFNDIRLFGYLFCLYYPLYEIDHCFVAVDKNCKNKIVGYIVGTDNTIRQKRQVITSMAFRVAGRLFFYTLFKYPESFKSVMMFVRNMGKLENLKELYFEYPAHLHINILPEYQHIGIGTMLIDRFEKHMAYCKILGIHLVTSSNNVKAIPFYYKKGYDLVHQEEHSLWGKLDGWKTLIFAKKINGIE